MRVPQSSAAHRAFQLISREFGAQLDQFRLARIILFCIVEKFRELPCAKPWISMQH
ncbi:hypothetical protein SAMN06295998_1416 [Primorskyibacter flagellatus]|uniref:Uncharacterized protein n=1 Tax=Primorskyibacter flagellatus TaxID=1387277 RepID=A0A1W2ES80_9RHOB|nr:hypothetical protein SAMN06295998_1416 [Primorskyibacter flagellatus]